MSTNMTTNGAPRARRAAAAAASQAINSQYNLPPVEQLSAPAPDAKSRRVDNGQPETARPRRTAAASASLSIAGQYNLPSVDELLAPAPEAKRGNREAVPARPRRAAAAAATLSIVGQYNLASVDELLSPEPAKRQASRGKDGATVKTKAPKDTIVAKTPAANTSPSSAELGEPASPSPTLTNPRPAKRARIEPKTPAAAKTSPALKTPVSEITPVFKTPTASNNLPTPVSNQDAPRRSSRATKRPVRYDVAPPLDLSDEEEIDANTVDDEDTEDDVFEVASDAEVDNEESDNDVVDAEFNEEDEWFVTAFSAVKDNETAADADAENEHDIVSPSRKVRGTVIFDEAMVDDNGMTRIGAQPQDEKPFVLTGPVEILKRELSKTVSKNLIRRDAKFPDAELEELIIRKAKLLSHLESLLVPHGEGRAKIICDYTGMEMSWGPGSQGRSLEAHYHFTVSKGRLQYHALPNVGLVFSTLNWLKRDSSILRIPLIALLLRTQQQRNFQVKQGIMSWAYIALQNVNVLETIHHCHGRYEGRLGKLGKLDEAEWKAILEDLRTGRLRPTVQEALRSWTRAQLLGGAHRLRGWLREDVSVPSNISWKAVSRWLQSVAERYGLTPDEFEFYCTVASPSRPSDRVFYPYSVLSRPEAEELSWDWGTLYRTAKHMLWRMRKYCNESAEKKGLGEKKMDELLFIVWWCHHLCRKIQAVKQEQPEATPEEIRLGIVDRWGLPIVPWTGNPLGASLCKLQDHGIAMMFGLAWPDGEEFDPVEHFDFNACTVTIDTITTNMAMRNFQPHTWPSILEIIKASPLSHSLWKIDPALGFESWIPGATWHTAMPPPEAPLSPFRIPLLPIDAWIDTNLSLPPLQCVECNDSPVFQTMGLLVRHCRTVHGGEGGNSRLTMHDSPDPEQDKANDTFWYRHKCPVCGLTVCNKSNLLRHMKKHTRPWPCRVKGCPHRFDSRRDVSNHLGVDHGWTVYRCDVEGCDAVFTVANSLAKHKQVHKEPLKCRKGCSKVFNSSGNRSTHERAVHEGVRFTCAVCGKAYMQKQGLQGHMAKKHPDVET